jgi:hypothetical protein
MSDTSRYDQVMKYCFGDDAEFVAVKDYELLQQELAETRQQRDTLAEALRVATAYPLSESWYKQAIEALATLKPCD